MGVPTVATDIRGCREVVRSGENGYVVPVKDAGALAEALGRVLGDAALASHLGARARALALAEFDEQIVFARVRAAYARLLEAKGITVPSAEAPGRLRASES